PAGRPTNDNMTSRSGAALSGLLAIDVAASPDAFLVKDVSDTRWHGPDYKGRFRVGGIKVNLDGAPQGKTAWLTQPYKVPPPGQGADYKGYPTFRDQQLFPVVREAV